MLISNENYNNISNNWAPYHYNTTSNEEETSFLESEPIHDQHIYKIDIHRLEAVHGKWKKCKRYGNSISSIHDPFCVINDFLIKCFVVGILN